MPTPTNLPSTVSKSLKADMKQLTSSVLPGLESLFAESTRCVEQRVARTVYPAFIKHQLAISTSEFLNGARDGFTYPGLAESFCLADVLTPDFPVVAASDAFGSVTGYSKTEALSKNCRFLQGSLSDQNAIKRIRDTIAREEESLELVLNYHRDGTPYWSLLFICPLMDISGKLRYYLGGQINVSASVGDCKDLLRILTSGPALGETREETSGRESRASRRMSRAGSHERKHERRASLRNRDSLHNKGPKKSLFQPFRKHAMQNTDNQENTSPSQGVGLGLEQLLTVSSSEEQLSVSTRMDPVYSAYSRLIILQNTDGPSGFPPRSSSLPADPTKRKAAQLSVAYCSNAALEALGLSHFADNITHRDIFTVLSELADSPSITKSFKNTVRERILRDGKSATLDIMLGGGYLARKGSLMGFGGGRASKDDSEGFTKKHNRPASRSGFASLVGEAGKMEKFISHWTPLKGAEEKVEWIVVIITPVK
ncbi:phototropin-1 [Colletotrichum spaethianum]|uniref:Phototropin-1 n=1 Tax=Colletotrichum spaethianum TaxID=700344 RepID=A0AA37LEQ0_9PEZI|nr:phototropin-1 [Colletotrichum spaethianum]GKT45195.1 phototropin-1 [Colletotrichum spaethianum]